MYVCVCICMCVYAYTCKAANTCYKSAHPEYDFALQIYAELVCVRARMSTRPYGSCQNIEGPAPPMRPFGAGT